MELARHALVPLDSVANKRRGLVLVVGGIPPTPPDKSQREKWWWATVRESAPHWGGSGLESKLKETGGGGEGKQVRSGRRMAGESSCLNHQPER